MGCGDSVKEKIKSNRLVSSKTSKKSEIKVVFLGNSGVGKSSIA